MFWLVPIACGSGLEKRALEVDGVERSYFVHVPEGLGPEAPIVIAFHGGGGHRSNKGRGLARWTGLAERADERGFVAVFPNSLEGNWNDLRTIPDVEAQDDVAFFDALLEDLEGVGDTRAVFVTGVSNGGFFTQRLACERSSRVRSAATLIATMPTELVCQPSNPVPMLFLVGTEDPLVPYLGGAVAGDRGTCTSAESAVATWLRLDGCTGAGATASLPDQDTADGTTSVRTDWTQCTAPVASVVVEGGGHTVPGLGQYLPELVIGRTSRDYDGMELVLDWLLAGR